MVGPFVVRTPQQNVSSKQYLITRWHNGQRREMALSIISEEPLAIRVQGHPYAVVMRTPGDDLAHAAGFCLTEGLIDGLGDLVNLASCDDGDTNVVTVTLTPERRSLIAPHLDRRGYISQTSCGICGKTLVDELIQELRPVDDPITIRLHQAEHVLRALERFQPLRRQSAASHAAVLFDADFNSLGSMEDVGRHNALDKAIGRLLLDRQLERAKIAVISSRISYELVQKAVRARIPILMALSRPTSLALDLALQLNISVVGATKTAGLMIFTHAYRLTE